MFHPKYSSNLHCNVICKCVISEEKNASKETTYVDFAHERVKTLNYMSSKNVTHNISSIFKKVICISKG